MEFRRLGNSGLKVSEIGVGCNNFGVRIDQAQSTLVVNSALDLGINLFDVADVYGHGASETQLGVAMGKRRHEMVLASKFAIPLAEKPVQRGGSRQYIMEAVEASLRRLKTDYLDVYQMHRPDPDTPIEETLRALDDLVRAGKVRYLGNSNFLGWQIADADWTAREGRLTRFVSAQNNYSLFERAIEKEVLPACERFGLGMLPYYPLAGGLLSGKYKRGAAAPENTRLHAWGARGEAMLTDRNFDIVQKLSGYAEARGHNVLQLAFAWLLGHKVVSSVIAGASNPDQVKSNVEAASWRLTPQDVEEVSALAS
jgi:aryl-alcohol dehydrogenase-like predicted oxidoreductase